MKINILKNIDSEHKMFYLFLIVHLTVWTLISLIRVVMPTDALEGIYWGSLHDFGTPKHPPLAGWLTYLAYLPFKKGIFVYFMSQAFIIGGFIYIYRLAKYFLNETQAMLSVILLEGCWCYSYITGYYGFNPDVILLFILPVIVFYFYNCMKTNKPSDWIKLGIFVGFSFLNKYQTLLIILLMALWAILFRRNTFRNKYFYLSIVIALLIFSPHIIWLIKYDFFPLMYFEEELSTTYWYHHITSPLIFILMQIVAILGTLITYFILKFKTKSSFKFVKEYNKEDFWFLILLGLGPILLHIIIGVINGDMRPRWGFEFWYLIGVMLFYFWPIKINKNDFILALKSSYVMMLIVFLSLGTLLTVEKNYRSRYPVAQVFGDIKTFWAEEVGTPLKYLGGYIEWTLPLSIYGDTHPECILDTFGYKNPWIDENELKNYGVFVIDRTSKGAINDAKKSCPYLPEDYNFNPQEYRFTLTNALNMPREYSVYYIIIPPINQN